MDVILLAIFLGAFAGIGLVIYERVINRNESIIVEAAASDLLNNSLKREVSTASNSVSRLIDYSKYKLTFKERLFYSATAGFVLFTIGFIFYHNLLISFFLALLGLLYQKVKVKELIDSRKLELTLQFKQSLYSLSSALGAGKSVENAFKEVIEDLKILYPNSNTYIIKEFEIINRRFENGEPIENAIQDFSRRADVEDIYNFADVFVTCKRTGGDLVEVIRRTSNIISNKIETQQEVTVLISQKKLEAKILSIAPFVIVALITFSSEDYMEPLYRFGIGTVVMTISLIILVISYLLSKWIMNIKV